MALSHNLFRILPFLQLPGWNSVKCVNIQSYHIVSESIYPQHKLNINQLLLEICKNTKYTNDNMILFYWYMIKRSCHESNLYSNKFGLWKGNVVYHWIMMFQLNMTTLFQKSRKDIMLWKPPSHIINILPIWLQQVWKKPTDSKSQPWFELVALYRHLCRRTFVHNIMFNIQLSHFNMRTNTTTLVGKTTCWQNYLLAKHCQ